MSEIQKNILELQSYDLEKDKLLRISDQSFNVAKNII
jgi:hypothetical protein